MTSIPIPPELAWIIPVVIPFVIGLLVGMIIKHSIKLILLIAILVILLIATGYVSFTYQDIFNKAMEFLPKLIDLGDNFKNVLPYSSLTFIIGLILGLWKG